MLNMGGHAASNFLKSNVAQYQPRMFGFWNTLKVYFTVRKEKRKEDVQQGTGRGARIDKERQILLNRDCSLSRFDASFFFLAFLRACVYVCGVSYQVDNGYVKKKLKVLLFPVLKKDWYRLPSEDEVKDDVREA